MDLEFLARLVELDTNSQTKSNYKKCAQLIKEEAEGDGLEVEVYNEEKPNLVISLNSSARNTLLLATHYDVVPAGEGWRHPPFRLTVKDGRAYGRGAADDKGGILSALSAMKTLKRRNTSKVNLKLLVTCDEEVGGEDGIGFLMKLKRGGRFVVEGDAAVLIDAGPKVYIGSSGRIGGRIIAEGPAAELLSLLSAVVGYSKVRAEVISKLVSASARRRIWGRISVTMLDFAGGAVEYARAGVKSNIIPGECHVKLQGRKEVVVKGRQGHAAYPHLAENPIEKALPLLREADLEGRGRCEIVFDLRTIPEESLGSALNSFKKHLGRKAPGARLQVLERSDGHLIPQSHPLVRMLKSATGERRAYGLLGGTDAHFFMKRGIPSVCFGPIGDDSNAHGKDEFVRIRDLRFVSDSLVRLCERWKL